MKIKPSRYAKTWIAVWFAMAVAALLVGAYPLVVINLIFAWHTFRHDVNGQVISALSRKVKALEEENKSLRNNTAYNITTLGRVPGAQYFD